jgi:tetratricopeptide (TPR) repeat protein
VAAWAYRRSTDPVNAQQALEEGRRLFKSTRYTEAILSLDHALALKHDLVDAYLLRGRANLALGRPGAAIQDLTQAIRLHPENTEAYVERAEARLVNEDYPGVIADATAALDRDSRLGLAYSLRGIAVRQSGNPRQSLADFTRAIELAPDQATYFQRAATYQILGEHALAIADLDQVIAMKPDGSQAYYARARSRRARGDVAGANQDQRRATLLDGR